MKRIPSEIINEVFLLKLSKTYLIAKKYLLTIPTFETVGVGSYEGTYETDLDIKYLYAFSTGPQPKT